MTARETIENLWDRATPVGPLLDAVEAEARAAAPAGPAPATDQTAHVEPDLIPDPPTALRIRVLREIIGRIGGTSTDDSATEEVGASTILAVLKGLLADLEQDAVLPAPTDQTADDLAAARATNQRLNLRAQRLESELAAYRRAVAQWEINERGAYVPLRSLAAIAKAAGVEVPERWELHYERVERVEAELRRLAGEARADRAAWTGAADWLDELPLSGVEGGVRTALTGLLREQAREARQDPTQDGETDEQRADREETERDHAAGDHTYCGITCETELPTEHLRNFVIAKGYPGTKGALDELLRRAAVARPGQPETEA